MCITTRLAHYQDIDNLVELDRACNVFAWSRQQFQAALDSPYHQIWVCCVQNKMIGLIVWQCVLDEMELHLIGTAPQYQRQGVATQLLKQMFQAAFVQKITKIFLEVRISNDAALNLYQQNGFIIVGKRKNYYRNQEDAIVMEKVC